MVSRARPGSRRQRLRRVRRHVGRWRIACNVTSHVTANRAPKRRLRYVVAAAGLLIVIGVLAVVKYAQIASLIGLGKQMEQAGPPPTAVGSDRAQTQAWASSIPTVGSVVGVESVGVSNDAPGIVSDIRFESGDLVRRGQILLTLDASTERAQLAAATARRDRAQLEVQRARKLVATAAIPRAELDDAETQLATAAGEVEALAAQIDRKIVRAPFAGRLGIRNVNLGQYLNAGTVATVLDSVGAVYVDFSVAQDELARVAVGMPVRITVAGTTEVIEGKVAAVEPTLDDLTRNAKLRASVPGEAKPLRPGMFVDVSVILPDSARVVTVPATAIVHAPYGDSVFVVEAKPPGSPGMATTPDGKPVKLARQQFVRVGRARGDFVSIAAGLAAGAQVVTAGAFKLRNGAPIVIDNTVTPTPQLDPRPGNR